MNEQMFCKQIFRGMALILVSGWIAVTAPAFGQAGAEVAQDAGVKAFAYDVVSVKPTKLGDGGFWRKQPPDGGSWKNYTLKWLISDAYGIKTNSLISGAPGWTESNRYDIEAKMDEDTAEALQKLPDEQQKAQRRLMLQSLLADRFSLKVELSKKEFPIYALVIAKGRPRLKEADPSNAYANGIKLSGGLPARGAFAMQDGKLTAQAVSMLMLTTQIALQVDRLVEDKTGLTGSYDFTLEWSPGEGGAALPNDSRPSLFGALQEQLGLMLEPAKEMVDGIVITHIEKPSAN